MKKFFLYLIILVMISNFTYCTEEFHNISFEENDVSIALENTSKFKEWLSSAFSSFLDRHEMLHREFVNFYVTYSKNKYDNYKEVTPNRLQIVALLSQTSIEEVKGLSIAVKDRIKKIYESEKIENFKSLAKKLSYSEQWLLYAKVMKKVIIDIAPTKKNFTAYEDFILIPGAAAVLVFGSYKYLCGGNAKSAR